MGRIGEGFLVAAALSLVFLSQPAAAQHTPDPTSSASGTALGATAKFASGMPISWSDLEGRKFFARMNRPFSNIGFTARFDFSAPQPHLFRLIGGQVNSCEILNFDDFKRTLSFKSRCDGHYWENREVLGGNLSADLKIQWLLPMSPHLQVDGGMLISADLEGQYNEWKKSTTDSNTTHFFAFAKPQLIFAAKAKPEAEAQAQAKAEAEAKSKLEAEARAKADSEARVKAEAEAKARAEVRAKADAEAKSKVEAEAKAKAEVEAKAKAEAEVKAKAAADAKRRALMTEKSEFAFKGDADDIVAIVNVGPESPNASLSLSGGVTFKERKAIACLNGATKLGALEEGMLSDKFEELKITPEKITWAKCGTVASLAVDVLVSRRSELTDKVLGDASILAKHLNEDTMVKGFVLEVHEVRDERSRREIERETLANRINKDAVKGYGFIVLSGESRSQVICNTASDLTSVFKDISREYLRARYFEAFDPSSFKVADVDTDTAFSSATKKQCRLIFGNEAALKALMGGFQRIKLEHKLDGPWLTVETVTAYREKKSEEEMKRIRADAEAKQRIADQQALAAERAKQSGAAKATLQREMRERNLSKVKKLESDFRLDLEKLVRSNLASVSGTAIAQNFPDISVWYIDMLKKGWEFETGSATVEVDDYGEATWKARTLPMVLLRANLALSHRRLGETKSWCFYAGYIDDERYKEVREAHVATCKSEGEETIRKWKIANSFKSGWIAE